MSDDTDVEQLVESFQKALDTLSNIENVEELISRLDANNHRKLLKKVKHVVGEVHSKVGVIKEKVYKAYKRVKTRSSSESNDLDATASTEKDVSDKEEDSLDFSGGLVNNIENAERYSPVIGGKSKSIKRSASLSKKPTKNNENKSDSNQSVSDEGENDASTEDQETSTKKGEERISVDSEKINETSISETCQNQSNLDSESTSKSDKPKNTDAESTERATDESSEEIIAGTPQKPINIDTTFSLKKARFKGNDVTESRLAGNLEKDSEQSEGSNDKNNSDSEKETISSIETPEKSSDKNGKRSKDKGKDKNVSDGDNIEETPKKSSNKINKNKKDKNNSDSEKDISNGDKTNSSIETPEKSSDKKGTRSKDKGKDKNVSDGENTEETPKKSSNRNDKNKKYETNASEEVEEDKSKKSDSKKAKNSKPDENLEDNSCSDESNVDRREKNQQNNTDVSVISIGDTTQNESDLSKDENDENAKDMLDIGDDECKTEDDKEDSEQSAIPKIKLVDINKLLAPNSKPMEASPLSKTRKSVTFDSSVIILLSSDEETPKKEPKNKSPLKSAMRKTSKDAYNSDSDSKENVENSKNKSHSRRDRHESRRLSSEHSSDSDFEEKVVKRKLRRSEPKIKERFSKLVTKRSERKLRNEERRRQRSHDDDSSDEDLSDRKRNRKSRDKKLDSESEDDFENEKLSKNNKKHRKVGACITDPKFKHKVFISLPKFECEQLPELYKTNKEVFEVKKLTNMDLPRRTRSGRNGSSKNAEDSDKPVQKRIKLTLKLNKKDKPTKDDSGDEREEEKDQEKEAEKEMSDKNGKEENNKNEETVDLVNGEDNDHENGDILTEEETKDDSAKNKDKDSDEDSKSKKKSKNTKNKEKERKNKESDEDNSDKDGKSKRKGKNKRAEKKSKDSSEESDNEDDKSKKNNKKKKTKNKESDEDSADNSKKEATDKEKDGQLTNGILIESSEEENDEPKKNQQKDKDNKGSDDSDNEKEKNSKHESSDSDEDFAKFSKKKDKELSRKAKKRSKKTAFISDSDSDNDKKKSKDSDYEADDKGSESDSDSEKEDKKSSSESEKEEQKKTSRKRIKRVKDSSSDEDDKSTRKKIRNMIDRDSLSSSTKKAEQAEKERKARIAEKQKKYNQIFDIKADATVDEVVLDFDEKTNKPLLSVHKKLVKQLKPHQVQGVKFMWDACFESLERMKKDKEQGSGCILAHCMGLGKTLQVITLTHTLLSNSKITNVEKIMVVCPVNTVLNWKSEFKKWLPKNHEIEVYELVSVKTSSINHERNYVVREWHENGGVLIIGYNMFRTLSNPDNKAISKKLRSSFHEGLVDPGPDLVVCDEGHLLKNEKTNLSIAMNRIKTLRRIVLTGTPLQNNLREYWCMVQFIKPNLLGTYKEYMNRFVNPITNGQYTDSTQHDIIVMRRRSHVLHKLLDGVVQRQDYSVLEPYLPPKYEYVLFLKLTEVQVKLYNHYLEHFARRNDGSNRTSFLFTDFQQLQRISVHPRVLLDKSNEDKEKKTFNDDSESEGSLKDFIDDESDAQSTSSEGSESGSDSDQSIRSDEKRKHKKKASTSKRSRLTRAQAAQKRENGEESDSEVEFLEKKEWWQEYIDNDELDNINHSAKIFLLFEILKECEEIGDKVLVFSQSLYTLNCIEYFLQAIDEATQKGECEKVGGHSGSWAIGLDYFRLDGSSSCDNRASWCDQFNNPDNTRARLFLISTKAGGLGINLVAANRVIIFDVSWNPSHDIQSIYRVYRFGQTKPSYIYRFVTYGSMEMKIYERQVTKQAISKRVIDEQQIDRHYSQNDIQELYKTDLCPEDRPIPLVPKDVLLGEMLQKYDKTIYKYHEHQSLLENKQDEELNEEERKAAWDEFENEKVIRKTTVTNFGGINLAAFQNSMNFSPQLIQLALASIVRKDNPMWSEIQVRGILPALVAQLQMQMSENDFSLYHRVQQEIRLMQAIQAQRLREQYMKQLTMQQMLHKQQLTNQMLGNLNITPEELMRLQAAAASQNVIMPPQRSTAGGSGDVIELND